LKGLRAEIGIQQPARRPKEQRPKTDNDSACKSNDLHGKLQQVAQIKPAISSNQELLLPGALFVAMGAQLLAPFMFINLSFSAFL
jgi:hypothetical protein